MPIYVAGSCDTKGAELAFVKQMIVAAGSPAIIVDVSTRAPSSDADILAKDIAAFHPGGSGAVFVSDRGAAVAAMAQAFAAFIESRDDLSGIVGLGGSGGTALITPAMQRLPIGMPKLMVSTVASGNVAPYVGPSDITMMYSVTDVAGINRISRLILANAAHAIAGMVKGRPPPATSSLAPAVGLTMFGVTTPCVNGVVKNLSGDYDCIVFHATGTGGQSMEKLADSGLLAGVIDVTTTEVCDLLVGGVLAATQDRFGAIARTGVPYVGSCGALDMVNFGAMETVPAQFRGRNLYVHNPQVTLMRTTVEESRRIGRWIAEKLNACNGPVRFLIPEKGVSLIDAPGQPFYGPEEDAALFAAIKATVRETSKRRVVSLPYNINDPPFAEALTAAFRQVIGEA